MAFFVGCYLAQRVADVSCSRAEEDTRDSKAVTSTRPFDLEENSSYGAMSETGMDATGKTPDIQA